jgi:DHA2 family metal-tetracycline-proton antiporter-like MFS transporter/DHA2 family florfenicol/chloramphenicol resistance protein-like MFS transporter
MSATGEAVRHGEPASARLFLAVVASAVFVSTLTGSMVNVLVPLVRAELGASAAQVGWVVTGLVY